MRFSVNGAGSFRGDSYLCDKRTRSGQPLSPCAMLIQSKLDRMAMFDRIGDERPDWTGPCLI